MNTKEIKEALTKKYGKNNYYINENGEITVIINAKYGWEFLGWIDDAETLASLESI